MGYVDVGSATRGDHPYAGTIIRTLFYTYSYHYMFSEASCVFLSRYFRPCCHLLDPAGLSFYIWACFELPIPRGYLAGLLTWRPHNRRFAFIQYIQRRQPPVLFPRVEKERRVTSLGI